MTKYSINADGYYQGYLQRTLDGYDLIHYNGMYGDSFNNFEEAKRFLIKRYGHTVTVTNDRTHEIVISSEEN